MNNKRLIFQLALALGVTISSIFPFVYSAWAQTKDATSAAAPVNAEDVKQSVKKRLENSVDEKLEKVKGVLEDTKKLYAFVGEVTAINENQLDLKRDDKKKQISFDKDTVLVFTGKDGKSKTLKSSEIKTGWFALSMGRIDENGTLLAQRIVFYDESPLTKSEFKVVFGKVKEIDNQKLVLKNHEELSLVVDKKTKLKISGVSEPQLADIAVDDKAVAILRKSATDKDYLFKAIFVWPGTTNPESKDNQINATESAAPAASPSPKP